MSYFPLYLPVMYSTHNSICQCNEWKLSISLFSVHQMNLTFLLLSPPDYAEPDVLSGGSKLGSTFRPPLDEGYTTPFALNHYDTPGRLPEYAEPLPPEPEYATPFGEQPLDPSLAPPLAMLQNSMHLAHHGIRIVPGMACYDSPPQKGLANGYCSPSPLGVSGAQRDSVVYAEPQPVAALHKHTYHEPL